MSLDAGRATAKLQTKEEVEFGQALIATGRAGEHPPPPGGGAAGGDPLPAGARQLGRDPGEAADAEHVVLIGGSYIAQRGGGVADRRRGRSCTMVMLEDVAMSRVFGDEAGRYFHELLASHGVELVTGDELEAFLGEGRVSGDPHQERARDRGRRGRGRGGGASRDRCSPSGRASQVDNGIVCDSRLETSVEGIFAAGDACCYDSVVHGRRLRVEHWDVALQQGQHVARGDAGRRRAVPGGAVLLQRPRRLGEPRVRGAGGALGRGRVARRPRRRRVQRLVPGRRAGSPARSRSGARRTWRTRGA